MIRFRVVEAEVEVEELIGHILYGSSTHAKDIMLFLRRLLFLLLLLYLYLTRGQIGQFVNKEIPIAA